MRLLLAAFAVLSCTAAAQTGTLDPAFGTGGRTLIPIAPGEYVRTAPLISAFPDGGVVIGSGTPTDAAVARLTRSGTLVTTFGTDGVARFSVGAGPNQVTAVEALADGRVVVAGGVLDTDEDFTAPFLVRLTASGALDPTFATGGRVTFGAADGIAESGFIDVAVLADGRLLALGIRYDAAGSPVLFTLRLTANGARDTSYGSDGIAQTALTVGGSALAIAGSGAYVVGVGLSGSQRPQAAVVRLTASGAPDATFGTGGQLFVDLGLDTSGLTGGVVDAQGRLVASGIAFDENLTQTRTALVRLTPSGTLDTSFDGDGVVDLTTPTGVVYLTSAVVRPDGRVVGVGGTGTLANGDLSESDVYVTQRREDGSPDPTFGTGGAFVFGSDKPEVSLASTLSPDGGLLVVGAESDGSETDFARLFVLRLVAPTSTNAEPPGASEALTLRYNGAHPAPGRVRLALTLDAPSAVRVDLVDARGRLVAHLADGPLGAGMHALEGPDGLPPGLYLARAVVAAGRATLPVVVVR